MNIEERKEKLKKVIDAIESESFLDYLIAFVLFALQTWEL